MEVNVNVDVRNAEREPQSSPPRQPLTYDPNNPFYFILEPHDRSVTFSEMKATLNNTILVKWRAKIVQEFPRLKIIVLSFPHLIKKETIRNCLREKGMTDYFDIKTSHLLINPKEKKKFEDAKKRFEEKN